MMLACSPGPVVGAEGSSKRVEDSNSFSVILLGGYESWALCSINTLRQTWDTSGARAKWKRGRALPAGFEYCAVSFSLFVVQPLEKSTVRTSRAAALQLNATASDASLESAAEQLFLSLERSQERLGIAKAVAMVRLGQNLLAS